MSDSADAGRRRSLDDVAAALRPLHKALVDQVQREYEQAHGQVVGPAALFHLVTRDPFFAWLRPLSGLMAQLDEALDEPDPLDASLVAEVRADIEELITEGGGEFSQRYLQQLQHSREVVVEHAGLRRALAKL